MVVREVRREATVGGVVLVLGMGVNGVMMSMALQIMMLRFVVATADGLRLLFFDAAYRRRYWLSRRVAGLSIAAFVDAPLLFWISWLFV